MMLRASKIVLVAAVAFFYTLVVFNNVTDYPSNYRFVHHVLLMDTTFPGNEGLWRAIHPFVLQTTFYDGIIFWESVTALLTWAGVVQLLRAWSRSPRIFQESKNIAIAALTLGMLLWFVAFITIGGEWFLMWQSKTWNGQDAAFRMFACIGIVLMVLVQPEPSTKLEG